MSKKIILAAVFLIIAVGVIWFAVSRKESEPVVQPIIPIETKLGPKHEVIGHSVQGRAIESYTYGAGKNHLVFVGGIHGGYEGNSVVLGEQFLKYLDVNPDFVPKNLTVTVIPDANPDGFALGKGAEARFNANKVDLNRNFDCQWQASATWQGKKVSAGTAAFSEPEARALRDFFLMTKPQAVVFWHSQANAVYASQCVGGILPETRAMMTTYAKAAGYPAVDTFDAYPVTGASEDWLASIDIPAITVELKTHEAIEWEKNLAGIKAVVGYYNR